MAACLAYFFARFDMDLYDTDAASMEWVDQGTAGNKKDVEVMIICDRWAWFFCWASVLVFSRSGSHALGAFCIAPLVYSSMLFNSFMAIHVTRVDTAWSHIMS